MNSLKISKQSIYIFWVILFIVTNLYLGKAKILGDYSVRVPIAILAVLYTLQFKNFYRINSYILLSIVYTIGYLLSTILNSYNIYEFISDFLISRMLFSFVFFYLILNTKKIQKIIIFIVLILFINTIFTIGQFLDIQVFWDITNKLLIVDEDSFNKSYNVFTKAGLVEGIAGTVYSGYINVVLIPLSFYLYYNSNKKAIYLLFILLTLFANFVLQQRGAFILVLFTTFLSIINFYKSLFKNILIIIITSILILVSFNYFISNFAGTIRLYDFTDIQRLEIYKNSLDFILKNPIWGGFNEFYVFNNEKSPHNLFLNAWIRGGIIGFFSIFVIVIRVMFNCSKRISTNLNEKNLNFYSSLAMINLIVLSLTHNASFATFDFLHYGVLAMFLNSQMNSK